MLVEPIILRTLGTVQVDVGRTQVRPNAVRRFPALLYLSAEAGRRVPRRCLIDLLFPEQTERNGLHSLRELVYQLKSLGVALDADQEGIELPGGLVRADYAEMLQSERLTLEQIRSAQGGFLPGYAPHESEAYTEWFEPFRAKTAFGLSQVLLRDHGRARDVANLELAEAAARACLAISPLNEKAIRALAEAMFLGGAKADATRLLDEYVAEMGSRSPGLMLSAEALRGRITERLPDPYRSPTELAFGGRDTEMLVLRHQFAVSHDGQTQCAIVLGEPGIGKTRLVTEFAAIANFETTRIERLSAQPHDRGRPMGTFIDLVPNLLQLPGAIGIAPESMDALRRLTTRSASGSPCPGPVDSESVSRLITHALDDLISAITAETHLTLIVEDAHWCDPLSLRALAELIRRRDRALFLVVTSRERLLPDLSEGCVEHCGYLSLKPLELGVCRELVLRALRGTTGASHGELHSWMSDVANGNPLFTSLLVTHFRATGVAFAVPPSLHELILKRLDFLDPAATVILQTCVLLSSLATLPRLVACLDLPFIEAVAAMERLESLGIVRCIDNRLLASHSLLADALLHRTSNAVLRMLHLRIAAVLEAELTPGDSPTVLWNCAEHWVAAGEHAAATTFLRQCANHAREIGRPGAAAQILIRIASLHLDLPSRIEVLRESVRLATQSFEHEFVLTAVEMLRALEPVRSHDDIELSELHVLSVTNRNGENYERRILACLDSPDVGVDHRVRAGLSGLQWADSQSKLEFAARIASSISDADLSRIDRELCLEYQLVYQTVLGDPLKAGDVARTITNLAPSMPVGRSAGLLLNASRVLIHAGDLEGAIASAEAGHQAAQRCGGARLQLQAALLLAGLFLDVGRSDLSRTWRDRAREARETNPHLLGEFEYRSLEIDYCLAEGDVDGAEINLSNAEREGVFNSQIRQRWHRVLRARLSQLCGGPGFSREEAAEIAATTTDSVPSTGIRDVEIAAIYTALCVHGYRREARTVVADFLSARHRHSRAPLSRQLRHALEVEAHFNPQSDANATSTTLVDIGMGSGDRSTSSERFA